MVMSILALTKRRSAHNAVVMHNVPLHDIHVGVWCAVSATRIIGPIYLDSNSKT